MSTWRYLVIEGNIGAGKTSLATALSKELNINLVLESFSNNPFLPDFYQNPEQYAFPLELSFLAERYQQLKNLLSQPDLFRPSFVADYSILKSLIFAQINLKDAEYQLFSQLFHIMNESLPQPDYIFYLYSERERLQQNIRKRGREYEQQMKDEYLLSIQSGYFESLKKMDHIPIVVFNVTQADFVHNQEHYSQIVKYIHRPPGPGMHFVNVG